MSTSRRAFLNTLCAASASVLLGCVAAAPATASAHATTATEQAAIVGGTVAATGSLPWLAQVSVMLPDGTGAGCSGTVVSARLILTAAHCVENLATGVRYSASDFVVTTGSADIDSASAQTSAVSRVIVNPGFTAPSQDNDSALLVLADATRAPAIALATTEPAAGTPATVAGWGVTSATSTSAPRLLRFASIVVQDDDTCAQAFGATFDPGSQLCAQDPPTDTTSACGGDSGGPLLATENGTTVEVGVTIYVGESCATTFPDVFTRSDTIATWVAARIAAVPARTTGRRRAKTRRQAMRRRTMGRQAMHHTAHKRKA